MLFHNLVSIVTEKMIPVVSPATNFIPFPGCIFMPGQSSVLSPQQGDWCRLKTVVWAEFIHLSLSLCGNNMCAQVGEGTKPGMNG